VAYAAANGQADFTHQQAALFYEKWRHGRHFEIKTSKQKSDWVNQKNIPAKFHPDPIWNDGALCFFEEHAPPSRTRWVVLILFYLVGRALQKALSSDMRSVPDLKSEVAVLVVVRLAALALHLTLVTVTRRQRWRWLSEQWTHRASASDSTRLHYIAIQHRSAGTHATPYPAQPRLRTHAHFVPSIDRQIHLHTD